MRSRLTSSLLFVLVIVLAVLAAQPYVDRWHAAPIAPSTVAAPTVAPPTTTPQGGLADYEQATIQIFDKTAPSVIQVVARASRARGAEGDGIQSGTGFIWDTDGHIVTNNHVVNGVTAIAVRFASGDVVPAELVGKTANYDLAVLRLASPHALAQPLALGQSANLKVGQAAFAIGNPFGLEQTLTTGVVSALKRRLPTSGGREIADVIQTDAPINPGNSGGPLLDSSGRLIGVTTAIFSPSGTNAGIGFAIPVDIVKRIVPELIRDGHVPTPGVGIIAADETIAGQLGVNGVIIAGVAPGSPAAEAGLQGIDAETGQIGDVITGAGGSSVRRLSDLTDQFEHVGVGGKINIDVMRDGKRRSVKLPVVDVTQQS